MVLFHEQTNVLQFQRGRITSIGSTLWHRRITSIASTLWHRRITSIAKMAWRKRITNIQRLFIGTGRRMAAIRREVRRCKLCQKMIAMFEEGYRDTTITESVLPNMM